MNASRRAIDELLEPRWSRVSRIQLIRQEIREFLSPSALDLLFERSESVIEGGIDGKSEDRAYATVMVTLDLRACDGIFREAPDEATAQRLAELLRNGDEVQRRLEALAREKLADLVGVCAADLELQVETEVRVEGCAVLLDGDAMASLTGLPQLGSAEGRRSASR